MIFSTSSLVYKINTVIVCMLCFTINLPGFHLCYGLNGFLTITFRA